MLDKKITVMMPAYNEEKDLPGLLDRIQSAMSEWTNNYQILVVDDGSHDRTAQIVNEAAARMPAKLIQ